MRGQGSRAVETKAGAIDWRQTVFCEGTAASAITHNVPLKALERWANESSVSPKQKLLKEPFGMS